MRFTPRLKDRHPSARKHARRSPVKPCAFHTRSELLEVVQPATRPTASGAQTRHSGRAVILAVGGSHVLEVVAWNARGFRSQEWTTKGRLRVLPPRAVKRA
jgi:hypothetical protein